MTLRHEASQSIRQALQKFFMNNHSDEAWARIRNSPLSEDIRYDTISYTYIYPINAIILVVSTLPFLLSGHLTKLFDDLNDVPCIFCVLVCGARLCPSIGVPKHLNSLNFALGAFRVTFGRGAHGVGGEF